MTFQGRPPKADLQRQTCRGRPPESRPAERSGLPGPIGRGAGEDGRTVEVGCGSQPVFKTPIPRFCYWTSPFLLKQEKGAREPSDSLVERVQETTRSPSAALRINSTKQSRK